MSARRAEPLALAVIDLDDFKGVNDRGGHAAGDRLLVELAGAWTASLRPGDLLARFGGDEFVLLLGERPRAKSAASSHAWHNRIRARWTTGAVLCSDEESLDDTIESRRCRLYLESSRAGTRPAGSVGGDHVPRNRAAPDHFRSQARAVSQVVRNIETRRGADSVAAGIRVDVHVHGGRTAPLRDAVMRAEDASTRQVEPPIS